MLIEDVLTEFKRTHLEHIEDIVLTDGYEGGKAVLEYFRGLLLTLKGSSSEAVSVSVKWDGAPAIFCGIDPITNKFFVGTKSIFNKNPKINFTAQDIDRNHGDSPGLVEKLKVALENSNRVGAVRVTPNTSASGQIYVLGKIIESNGYKVKIKVKVIDASGKKILDKDFSKKIDSSHYNNARTKNIDAYNPLFEEASLKIIEKIEKLNSKKISDLINISNLRFGAEFSPESFDEYLKRRNNKFSLKALPSEDDPMWQRVNSIMIREQLFVDSLQSHYDKFANISNQSYVLWQSQSYNEIIAERTAKTKAVGRGILGALSIAAAVASASSPRSEYNDDFSGEVAMLTLGGKLLEDAAKYKAEAKMHRDSIKELGDSIDAELAPNVIEFENKTIELSGNAKQQFIEWRNFLKKMYELEKTPDIQL